MSVHHLPISQRLLKERDAEHYRAEFVRQYERRQQLAQHTVRRRIASRANLLSRTVYERYRRELELAILAGELPVDQIEDWAPSVHATDERAG